MFDSLFDFSGYRFMQFKIVITIMVTMNKWIPINNPSCIVHSRYSCMKNVWPYHLTQMKYEINICMKFFSLNIWLSCLSKKADLRFSISNDNMYNDCLRSKHTQHIRIFIVLNDQCQFFTQKLFIYSVEMKLIIDAADW